MAPIIINGNLVDLDSGHKANDTFSHNSKDGDYILVETHEELYRAEIAEIEGFGATLQECVADNVYLFRYPHDNMQQIRDLKFVRKVGEYAKGLKVNSQLQQAARLDPTVKKEVYAVLHEDKDKTPREAADVLAGRLSVNTQDIHVDGNRLRLNLELEKLNDLSKIDVVRTVEEVPVRTLTNTAAKKVLNADIIINNTPYRGAGQVVAVADSGFDKGSSEDVHPAFKGRVRQLIPIGRANKTNDTDGHGTHVCGSLLGSKVADAKTDKDTEGIAPKAELVFQSLATEKGGIFQNQENFPLKDLFLPPYKEHGACIHSNSWGSQWTDKQQPYGEEAKQIDECVFENPDLLIIFAAGNNGHKWPYATLGSHAAAKNCLTVGATDSSRPSVTGAFNPDKRSLNDTTEIAYYSNRGPTLEGRIKPDVVAPGTAILSTRSRDYKDSNIHGRSGDPLWQYNTGTSMATPLVAGCAVILREALVKNGMPKPSAALLKALLINGAYAFHHAHSAKEGFGRVNLAHSIILPRKTPEKASNGTSDEDPNKTPEKEKETPRAGFEIGPPLKDRDEKNKITVEIPKAIAAATGATAVGSYDGWRVSPPSGPGVTLKATLVYTDRPSDTLQNILNLSVISGVDKIRRNGNMGSNSSGLDTYNNVEQVIWKGIPPGPAHIIVQARRVLSDQDYALVWRIIETEE